MFMPEHTGIVNQINQFDFNKCRNKGEIVLEGHEGSINSCCFNSDGEVARVCVCVCDNYYRFNVNILWM